MTVSILQGDALTELHKLPSNHFHCVVTSPPYWGLRDYGTGVWEGGDPACDHITPSGFSVATCSLGASSGGRSDATHARSVERQRRPYRDTCGKCGARRIDQQIGLEASPDEWVARLVEVFREVRRVLRSDGTLWLNIGDSYAAGKAGRTDHGSDDPTSRLGPDRAGIPNGTQPGPVILRKAPAGYKSKDLVGQPWMLAFALRADGWWLRSEIIWAKPNPMPESVTDRPTKAHEQVFLFTKEARYSYDAEAVREKDAGLPSGNGFAGRQGDARHTAVNGGYGTAERFEPGTGRNLRSVWTIATDPLPSVEVDGEKLDHFASYPVELARRCILAGTSAKGCCSECGAPWARVVERETENRSNAALAGTTINGKGHVSSQVRDGHDIRNGPCSITITTGWRPTCLCSAPPEPALDDWRETGDLRTPCRVLDPFGGSGRTALAAAELGRDCTLIELSPKSCAMAKAQLERALARRMIGDVSNRTQSPPGQMDLGL